MQTDVFKNLLVPEWLLGGLIHLNITKKNIFQIHSYFETISLACFVASTLSKSREGEGGVLQLSKEKEEDNLILILSLILTQARNNQFHG